MMYHDRRAAYEGLITYPSLSWKAGFLGAFQIDGTWRHLLPKLNGPTRLRSAHLASGPGLAWAGGREVMCLNIAFHGLCCACATQGGMAPAFFRVRNWVLKFTFHCQDSHPLDNYSSILTYVHPFKHLFIQYRWLRNLNPWCKCCSVCYFVATCSKIDKSPKNNPCMGVV